MDRKCIYVVDDEETLCEALKFNLEIEGYEVRVAHSAEQVLREGVAGVDLLLLDVMMGGMSGFHLAKQLREREQTASIPIIFLTAKDAEDDMVRGLTIGADDYITKPFSLRNVVARVRSVLRRAEQARPDTAEPAEVCYEGIVVNTLLKEVRLDGELLRLPRKEYEILLMLLSERGRVFSREEILRRVWEDGTIVVDRTVDVNITRLRQKLGAYASHIITRPGYGYGFVE